MRRKLLNVATVLSLLLCGATFVLCIVSCFRPIDYYSMTYAGPMIVREDKVWTNRFQIVAFFRRNADINKPFDYHYGNFQIPGTTFHWSRRNGGFFEFHFDYWFLFAVGGAIPLTRLARAIRLDAHRRRAARGLCMSCGYDLRATPDRCPECGTVPKVTDAAG